MIAKPGRPKSPTARTATIKVRVTPEEADILRHNAKQCGATVAEYTRTAWGLLGEVMK